MCSLPAPCQKASVRVKTLKSNAFQTRGPKLFNALPFTLRELSGCSLNIFKNKLDKYLSLFPDTPLSQKYYPLPADINTGHPSNSIIDWTRYFNVPIRTSKSLENIDRDIKNSNKYIEILNSEWSHLLATPPPPDADKNLAA